MECKKVFNGYDVISKFIQAYGESYCKVGINLENQIYGDICIRFYGTDIVGKSWNFVVNLDRPLQPEVNDIIVDSRQVEEELDATFDWETDFSIFLYVNEYADNSEMVTFKFLI